MKETIVINPIDYTQEAPVIEAPADTMFYEVRPDTKSGSNLYRETVAERADMSPASKIKYYAEGTAEVRQELQAAVAESVRELGLLEASQLGLREDANVYFAHTKNDVYSAIEHVKKFTRNNIKGETDKTKQIIERETAEIEQAGREYLESMMGEMDRDLFRLDEASKEVVDKTLKLENNAANLMATVFPMSRLAFNNLSKHDAVVLTQDAVHNLVGISTETRFTLESLDLIPDFLQNEEDDAPTREHSRELVPASTASSDRSKDKEAEDNFKAVASRTISSVAALRNTLICDEKGDVSEEFTSSHIEREKTCGDERVERFWEVCELYDNQTITDAEIAKQFSDDFLYVIGKRKQVLEAIRTTVHEETKLEVEKLCEEYEMRVIETREHFANKMVEAREVNLTKLQKFSDKGLSWLDEKIQNYSGMIKALDWRQAEVDREMFSRIESIRATAERLGANGLITEEAFDFVDNTNVALIAAHRKTAKLDVVAQKNQAVHNFVFMNGYQDRLQDPVIMNKIDELAPEGTRWKRSAPTPEEIIDHLDDSKQAFMTALLYHKSLTEARTAKKGQGVDALGQIIGDVNGIKDIKIITLSQEEFDNKQELIDISVRLHQEHLLELARNSKMPVAIQKAIGETALIKNLSFSERVSDWWSQVRHWLGRIVEGGDIEASDLYKKQELEAHKSGDREDV